MKKIYLSGQRSFSNRGCEAIVRSTVDALRVSYSDIEVLVPSDDIPRDQAQWPEAEHSGVRFVPAYLPRHTRIWAHTQRLPLPFLKSAGWPFPFPRWVREQLSSVDAVLSVGGDNYSLDYRLPSLLQGIDKLALDLGKPVMIWGASVGPFGREPHFVPSIQKHLGQMNRIFVRESVSNEYLVGDLKLSNVSQMADPAFTLQPKVIDYTEYWPQHDSNGVIGLNVSPLIERYKSEGQDLISEVIAFVRETVQEAGYSVLLVPHVIPLDGSSKNNDAIYMAQVLAACTDLGDRVKIVPDSCNAAELKHIIGQLRFFIGARTHATIAALSSEVPTISIAYSVKARGINRDLFGNEDVVLPTPELSSKSLREKRDYLIANEANLKQVLADRIPDYRDQVFNAINTIGEVVSD